MSEPSIENSMIKLEQHIKRLINQPIVEFQVRNNLQIESISVDLMHNKDISNSPKSIKQIIIIYS